MEFCDTGFISLTLSMKSLTIAEDNGECCLEVQMNGYSKNLIKTVCPNECVETVISHTGKSGNLRASSAITQIWVKAPYQIQI